MAVKTSIVIFGFLKIKLREKGNNSNQKNTIYMTSDPNTFIKAHFYRKGWDTFKSILKVSWGRGQGNTSRGQQPCCRILRLSGGATRKYFFLKTIQCLSRQLLFNKVKENNAMPYSQNQHKIWLREYKSKDFPNLQDLNKINFGPVLNVYGVFRKPFT